MLRMRRRYKGLGGKEKKLSSHSFSGMFLGTKREAMRHRLAAPVARLASSLVAFFFGEASVNLLVSLNMRPEPVQLVYPNITVLNPNHLAPFIPDSEASCPGALLIVLIVVAWVCVIALNRSTLPAALDAASVFALGQVQALLWLLPSKLLGRVRLELYGRRVHAPVLGG